MRYHLKVADRWLPEERGRLARMTTAHESDSVNELLRLVKANRWDSHEVWLYDTERCIVIGAWRFGNAA